MKEWINTKKLGTRFSAKRWVMFTSLDSLVFLFCCWVFVSWFAVCFSVCFFLFEIVSRSLIGLRMTLNSCISCLLLSNARMRAYVAAPAFNPSIGEAEAGESLGV